MHNVLIQDYPCNLTSEIGSKNNIWSFIILNVVNVFEKVSKSVWVYRSLLYSTVWHIYIHALVWMWEKILWYWSYNVLKSKVWNLWASVSLNSSTFGFVLTAVKSYGRSNKLYLYKNLVRFEDSTLFYMFITLVQRQVCASWSHVLKRILYMLLVIFIYTRASVMICIC